MADDYYVSTGDGDDHMTEGIPADSVYQDDVEKEDWKHRYLRKDR
jgi:hypothetical protein